jgi:hypothetical protein
VVVLHGPESGDEVVFKSIECLEDAIVEGLLA